MKTVFNTRDCITTWARQSQPTGHANSVSFDGADLRSYNQVIGRILPATDKHAQLVLTCDTCFSMTTSHHQSTMRSAVCHLPCLSVPKLEPGMSLAEIADGLVAKAMRMMHSIVSRVHVGNSVVATLLDSVVATLNNAALLYQRDGAPPLLLATQRNDVETLRQAFAAATAGAPGGRYTASKAGAAWVDQVAAMQKQWSHAEHEAAFKAWMKGTKQLSPVGAFDQYVRSAYFNTEGKRVKAAVRRLARQHGDTIAEHLRDDMRSQCGTASYYSMQTAQGALRGLDILGVTTDADRALMTDIEYAVAAAMVAEAERCETWRSPLEEHVSRWPDLCKRLHDLKQQVMDRWRATGDYTGGLSLLPCMLRATGNEVDSSRGVTMPVTVLLWQLLWSAAQGARAGEVEKWNEQLDGLQVGRLMFEGVSARGDLTLGQHVIPYEEVARLARTLNL